ncbi:MAG: zinc-dependent metalloprotease, partial [Bacteroidota bacterium]
MRRTPALFLLAAFAASFVVAQTPPAGGTVTPPAKTGPKKYDEVITKEAKSDSGLFVVHRIKSKLYYEVPFTSLGKEMILVSTQARTQGGIGYGGDAIARRVVTWDRIDERIMLRSQSYAAIATDSLPVAYAVQKANNAPILMAFDPQAYNKDSTSVVIEVTELFTTDVAELGLGRNQRDNLTVRRLDPKRSYLEFSRSFPANIETEATVTYESGQVPLDGSLSTITMTFHHSMVVLPEQPMKPRLADERVGFFGVQKYDYGFDAQRAEVRRYISRWRLEPKDPEAIKRGELSDPIKPITFYIDRGVPEKWRPYLKQGVEDWQAAFEKAGFQSAIVGVIAPPVEQDPDWSSEDARYSTIRWLPSEIENAYGPHIPDPRSGEILDADIGFFHNVMNLARNWYFVQAGNVDPQAAKLPLPDALMGELLRYIAAHEVGHSLGFPHNWKSSSFYPVDSLRSMSFTQKYGDEASIMDYGRFNYIAQPGDGASPMPKVGPYDMFAVEWGYRPIFDAKTPDDERETLNRIAARQETEPYLRFGVSDANDPTVQTEDLGDDAVKATTYGLKNLRAITKRLIPATTEAGKDYSTLREIYGEIWGQRNRELGHVANYVGGVIRTQRIAGQEGVVHTPVSRAKQKEAMTYLKKEGFTTPADFLAPEVLVLIEPTGSVDRVAAGHRSLLNILLNNDRMARLVNTTALTQKERPYTLSE